MANPPPSDSRSLETILDDTAEAIAEKILASALSDSGGHVDLAKSFSIIAAWAAERDARRQSAKPKEKSKVDQLRDRFHGHTTPTGRTRRTRASKGEGGAGGDGDIAADPAGIDNGG